MAFPVFEENQGLAKPGWDLETARRRLLEISGEAGLTAAAALCAQAQAAGDAAAWVMTTDAGFFAPDMAAAGVSLESLAVVRVPPTTEPEARKRASRPGSRLARAATILAQSGGFGVIVIDLGGIDIAGRARGLPQLSMATQGRLHQLAVAHDAAIACVTQKPESAPSLGSMVSLHVYTEVFDNHFDNHPRITLRALKDKRRGPGWDDTRAFHGPPGLR